MTREELLLKACEAYSANIVSGPQAAMNAAIALVLEEAAKVIDDNMLCSDPDGTEVLMERGNSGNKVGLAYSAAIRALGKKQ